MTARRLVVDGMNVIGSRPDGWWRDRPAAMDTLVRDLDAVARAWDSVTVVFDGRPRAGLDGSLVEVIFARRPGRDAADDRIVELVGAADDPGDLVVVTSDRLLGDRLRAVGAGVERVGWLRSRMGDPATDGAPGFRSP
ncbi:MAG: NYN domain-containing protein [Acidimicrobiales bacterium]